MPSVLNNSYSSEMLGTVENFNSNNINQRNLVSSNFLPPPNLALPRHPPPIRNNHIKYFLPHHSVVPEKIVSPPNRSPKAAAKSRSYFFRICLILIVLAVILSCVQLSVTYHHNHCCSKVSLIGKEGKRDKNHNQVLMTIWRQSFMHDAKPEHSHGEAKLMSFPRNFPLPLPPNATENAAELKRLRLIRESLQRKKFILAPSIFKPAIEYDPGPWSLRPRALVALPNNSLCALNSRERVTEIPAFTRFRENVRPKYAVVSLVVRSSAHNADNTTLRSIMHELTFLNKLQYCKLHGYDFILEDETAADASRPPHWSKIRLLRKWLPFYEWIVWVDMDVILTNWERKIEDLVGDELTRHLLNDLQRQEATTAHARSRGLAPEQRHVVSAIRSVQRRRAQMAAEKKRGSWMIRNGIRNEKNQEGDRAAIALFLNTTSDDSMQEFKMKQVDLILTHDRSGMNTGVMFLRNSWWTHNFLRRIWAVPASLTRPYFDQGAFIYLLTPGFRGRDVAQAEIDRNHLWDTDDNTFNANHENFIAKEIDRTLRWEDGDWMMHLASCRSHAHCLDTISAFCDKAACDNPHHAFRAPVYDRNGVDTWTAPARYIPPSDEQNAFDQSSISLPPLNEELWDVSNLSGSDRGEYLPPRTNEDEAFIK